MRYIEAKLYQANPHLDLNKISSNGNILTISPIPRGYTLSGAPIYENRKSCSYKPFGDNNQPIIYDHTGKGYNEISLIKKLEGVNFLLAHDISDNYLNSEKLINEINLNLEKEVKTFSLTQINEITTKYNWTKIALSRIKMFVFNNETFSIPIINNNVLLSIATYNADSSTKWRYSKNVKGALIFNYDNWLLNPKPTIICEGPKDMLTLLSLGYNAISFTNGASVEPKLYPNAFKDKECVIIYDNDEAGKNGSKRLAAWLWANATKNIKVIDISNICKNKGEDIWDYFNIYKKTKNDLNELIKNTNGFSQTDYLNAIMDKYPLITIEKAKHKDNLNFGNNKYFQTDIEIKAADNRTLILPERVDILYRWTDINKDSSDSHEKKTITFKNKRDMLTYMKPDKVQKERLLTNIKGYITNKKKFELIDIKFVSKELVYKYDVSQAVNEYKNNDNILTSSTEQCYSIGKQLELGNKYRVTYMITSHPDSVSDLIILITEATKLDVIETEYLLTKLEFQSLKTFQQIPNETINDALNRHLNNINYYIGWGLEKKRNLWLAYELLYHSAYEYQWESGTVYSGLIVLLIFGDPSYGKSHIFTALNKLYEKGTLLTGNNTTVAALIGGTSTRAFGERKTVTGIAAFQNKGLIALEEFTNAPKDMLDKITDFITSGKVRIARVDDNILVHSQSRWLFIANTKSNKKLTHYRNGMIPFNELIPELQWKRRFDLVVTVSSHTIKNKDGTTDEPPDKIKFENLYINKELYRLKVHWIWTRASNNIIISDKLKHYAWNLCSKWIKEYGNRMDIVGDQEITILKKIYKIAIACAGILFSTYDGINLIVTESHINWAYEYIIGIYDNDTFRLRNLIEEENKYIDALDDDIKTLQKLWNVDAVFIDTLFELGFIKSSNDARTYFLKDDHREFRDVWITLCKNRFLKPGVNGHFVTDKFRNAYEKLNFDEKPQEKEKESTYDI